MRSQTATVLARGGAGGLLGLLLGLAGCIEPYLPAVVDAPASYPVVDGAINGNGVTTIRLSRTAKLASAASPPVERGARLVVTDNAGGRSRSPSRPPARTAQTACYCRRGAATSCT